VTLVVDAAPLVALADRRDRMQAHVAALLRGEPGELVVPAPVTSAVDDLRPARRRLDRDDHEIVIDLERRYAEHDVGLALRPLDGGHFSLLPLDG